MRMPAKDVTATASWTEKPTGFVEIVLGKKDLKEEEVERIIREYTDSEFSIEKFEADDKTRGSLVIAKFTDNGKAEEFVRNINEIERLENNFIRNVNVISENNSFSPIITPTFFNISLI